MTSTRLPGKVLRCAGGRTMLDHQLDRLAPLDLPIIVATTANIADDPVAELSIERGAGVFRGSENDVLGRFAGAAREAALDAVVRITSDCPLIDASVIQRGIDRFLELDDPDAHVSNVIERTYPRGFDFEVFSVAALLDADVNATDPADREHVTPYLYANRSGRATLHAIRRGADASGYRVTLDTPEDFEIIRRLIEDHRAHELSAEGIIRLLDENPALVEINAHIEQKKLDE